jgi:ABC-2 type transport system ATP-binding protein
VNPDRLIVETRAPDDFYNRMLELATRGDYDIRAMTSLDDNLEAVFRYLVK